MQREFVGWQKRLECEPGFWAVLYLKKPDGVLWRNRASREHYAAYNFWPSPTIPWSAAAAWMEPQTFQAMELGIDTAFQCGPVTMRYHLRAPQGPRVKLRATFRPVAGNPAHGLVVIHYRGV